MLEASMETKVSGRSVIVSEEKILINKARAARFLGKTIAQNRAPILKNFQKRLQHIPSVRYKSLLLHTDEGEARLKRWINLAVIAYLGDPEPLFQDQFEMGCVRAREGFSFSDLANIPRLFILSVFDILKEQDGDIFFNKRLITDLQELVDVIFYGFEGVAQSFIVTREQIISEKIYLLQQLYQFTKKIMGTLSEADIIRITIEDLNKIFGLNNCCIDLYDETGVNTNIYCDNKVMETDWAALAKEAWETNKTFFISPSEEITEDVNKFEYKKGVLALICGYEMRHGVVLLYNGGQQFRFGDNELELLKQLLYITAMVLENYEMVEQIEQDSRRLRLLTIRTLDISEQERRKISEEIHDTLTQSLTAMSYGLQYCLEISASNPELLQDELKKLISMVGQAIGQSRDIIASLHPDVIDNIGLVSALEKLFENFSGRTGIDVDYSFPDELDLPPKLTAGVFRVVQEALTNIYKHARATQVNVVLEALPDKLNLIIKDDGKGFHVDSDSIGMPEQGKFGLFYMQQRLNSLNGSLSIESAPKCGCTLTATLPVASNQDIFA